MFFILNKKPFLIFLSKKIQKFFFRRKGVDLGVSRVIFFSLIIYFYSNTISPTEVFVNHWESNWMPISFFQLIPIDWVPQLPWTAINFFYKFSLWFCLFGLMTQFSMIICFLTGLLVLGLPLNFGKIHHSSHLWLMVIGILCLVKHHALSIDYLIAKYKKNISRKKRVDRSAWPSQLIIIYMCTIYFEAGFQKIRHSGLEWIFSDNFTLMLLTRPTVTKLGVWVALQPLLSRLFGLSGWILQFFAPTALFFRYNFFIFGFGLCLFHIMTYLLMGNQGFFFGYSFCFLFWISWSHGWRFIFNKIQCLNAKLLQ